MSPTSEPTIKKGKIDLKLVNNYTPCKTFICMKRFICHLINKDPKPHVIAFPGKNKTTRNNVSA